ncbi:MAG: hypothetical protein ACYCTE_12885 [Acidimicrobiales bacterium]
MTSNEVDASSPATLARRQGWPRRRGPAVRALLVTLVVVAAMAAALHYWLREHPYSAASTTTYKATDAAGVVVILVVAIAGLVDAGRKWYRSRPRPRWSRRNEPATGGIYTLEDDDSSVFVVAEKLLGDHRRWREIWVLNERRRVSRTHVWTIAHQRLEPGYAIAVPDAALRRLAEAHTTHVPVETFGAAEQVAPRQVPVPRRGARG